MTERNWGSGWTTEQYAALDALFEKARKERRMFYKHQGGPNGELWFTPDELEEEQAKGNFRWPAGMWLLSSRQAAEMYTAAMQAKRERE